MSGFESFHSHERADEPEEFRGIAPTAPETDEAVARRYLDQLLAPDEVPEFLEMVAPEHPARVPGISLLDTQGSPVRGNRVIRFRQSHGGIPLFGSRIVVEIGPSQEFVAADLRTARVDVSPIAQLSPADALRELAERLNLAEVRTQRAPVLVFFEVRPEKLLLAYLVEDVPVPPPDAAERVAPGERRVTLETDAPRDWNYLVDANRGDILYSYPSGPTLVASLCMGVDDLGQPQQFNGLQVASGFEMSDPDRAVSTHDNQFALIDGSPTPPPVGCSGADWADSNRAAVSAHVNATRVHDFYEGTLHRKSIDDKGMALVSVVNCTKQGLASPPEWINAQWRSKEARMVYGQRLLANGTYQSLATFLDVIAHELTHGITGHTAALIYQDESGALNESISDILGVIVNNWYLHDRNDVDTWDWEIGPGLGQGGKPLRNASSPATCGCPEKMRDYQHVTYDLGGVHINSGIHTLAAVHVLRSCKPDGKKHFTPGEVAGLYYSTLQRLPAQATFAETRKQLAQVVATRYAGFPADQAENVSAVHAAYDAVGIV